MRTHGVLFSLVMLALFMARTESQTQSASQPQSQPPLPPVPQALPTVIPQPPQGEGVVTAFVRQIEATSGIQSRNWTSVLGAPIGLDDVLEPQWKWRGGASIVGNHPGLGGLSGLEVERLANGSVKILAVSDSGYWLGGELSRMGLGQYDTLTLSPPLAIATTPGAMPNLAQNNAEAMAIDTLGNVLVALEGDHRVQRHLDTRQAPSVLSVPTALKSAEGNKGVEALASLADGRYFAVGEGIDRQGGMRAWVFHDRSGDWPTMVYRKDVEDGFAWNPTAAAVMGDQILLVERWWNRALKFRNRLVSVPISDVAPGASLQPQVLFELSSIVGAFGNIEGLAVTDSPNGSLVVFVTDNQEIPLLPTMIFALEFVE